MTVEEDRAELAMLQKEWMQAVADRDMDRLEEIVAPGFRFTAIHLNPEPMTREQWMEAAREGYTIVSFAYESMEIDVHGATAVVQQLVSGDGDRPAGSSSRSRRPARPHPFAAPVSALAALHPGKPTTTTLLLPSRPGGPLASPELVRDGPRRLRLPTALRNRVRSVKSIQERTAGLVAGYGTGAAAGAPVVAS